MLCLNPVVVVKLIKIWIILISIKFQWIENQNVDFFLEFCHRDI